MTTTDLRPSEALGLRSIGYVERDDLDDFTDDDLTALYDQAWDEAISLQRRIRGVQEDPSDPSPIRDTEFKLGQVERVRDLLKEERERRREARFFERLGAEVREATR